MCRLVRVTHFGCDENHVEVFLVRCKPGLEHILNMPFKDYCKGMFELEDWVMSPCRFCKEYLESRKPLMSAGRRARSLSLQEGSHSEEPKETGLKGKARDDIVLAQKSEIAYRSK